MRAKSNMHAFFLVKIITHRTCIILLDNLDYNRAVILNGFLYNFVLSLVLFKRILVILNLSKNLTLVEIIGYAVLEHKLNGLAYTS